MQLKVQNMTIDKSYSLESLKNSDEFELLLNDFKSEFGFKNLNTFTFANEGFLSMMLDLNGSIAISLGENEEIIQAGKLYEKYVNKVVWIGLTNEGKLNYDECKNINVDFFFVSSFITDTFAKTSLEKVKELTSAKIVANCSAYKYAKIADIILIDAYKLCGYKGCGIVLYNDDELYEKFGNESDALVIKLVYEALKSQIYKQRIFYEDIELGV